MPVDSQRETLPEPGVRSGSQPGSMVGKVLKGQYRIEAQLGQGAMGIVFRGVQIGLGKTVAIKMIRSDILVTKDSHDRFQREAQVLSKLLHPGIAQVLDFGIDEGTPFLVMEFVDGKELTDVMTLEGPMAPARAIAIVRQLAAALEEAHRNGIVHRDIKPQNIRLQRYSPTGQIYLKVLDFGIAKQLGDENGQSLTATGAVIGTPAYMAPEQAGGSKVDARADQYAVGVVLYELLTGTVPFVSDTVTGVLVSHLTKPPPPLPREVPEPLQRIVMRLLEKEPTQRYPDIGSLERALADCEGYCRDARALSKGTVRPTMAGDLTVAMQKRSIVPVIAVTMLAAVVAVSAAVVVSTKLRAHSGPKVMDSPKLVATAMGPEPARPSVPDAAATGAPDSAAAKPATPTATASDHPTTPSVGATATAKPSASDKPSTGSSPRHTASVATPASEPPAIKEQLDRVEKLLRDGDFPKAIELANQTTFTQPTARAYRQMTFAHCKMGSFSAQGTFHRVAAPDRKKLVSVCKENGVPLP